MQYRPDIDVFLVSEANNDVSRRYVLYKDKMDFYQRFKSSALM